MKIKWPIIRNIIVLILLIVMILYITTNLITGITRHFLVELQTAMLLSGIVGILLGTIHYSKKYKEKQEKEQKEMEAYKNE